MTAKIFAITYDAGRHIWKGHEILVSRCIGYTKTPEGRKLTGLRYHNYYNPTPASIARALRAMATLVHAPALPEIT